MTEFVKSLLVDFWFTVAEMSPFLLFGFFVAGVLSVLVSRQFVENHLGGRGLWPLVKASLFGVPLPLCSCGVIPVAMSLRKHGASKGSVISFLISTPQTGVDSIFVTFSLLGPLFTIFRPIAAFLSGIIGGSLTNTLTRLSGLNSEPESQCEEECCTGEPKQHRLKRGLKYAFVTLPRDIGKAMLVGLLVAAFISVVVPDDFFAGRLGHPVVAMLVMVLVGIPIYVCATASVPIAAALIIKGISPGTALVFLMTGPATNAASFITIWKGLGRTTAFAYLTSVIGCALVSGLLLDYIVSGSELEIISRPGWMLPGYVKHICAVILLVVLLSSTLSTRRENHNQSMGKVNLG
ncbi:MAG: SO_0444 family Cu/Zn efflux transporter [Planctomycetota bacterium]